VKSKLQKFVFLGKQVALRFEEKAVNDALERLSFVAGLGFFFGIVKWRLSQELILPFYRATDRLPMHGCLMVSRQES